MNNIKCSKCLDGEGYSIDIDDCSIEFAMEGAISFRVNANIDDKDVKEVSK